MTDMSFLPYFSHLYVEDEARTYPLTESILSRFSKASIVPIEHYKQIFNRPRQHWSLQAKARKLILAVRRDNFTYEISDYTPSYGHERFFYTIPVLNCLYDCGYCYLQGMLPSGNVVIFVNPPDYFSHVRNLAAAGPLYLALSYDTDLPAFEGIAPLCKEWIEFAGSESNVTVELRTKSGGTRFFDALQPTRQAILAWTVSPNSVVEKFEHRTASLDRRLAAARSAAVQGWRVRLCIDPILDVDGWRTEYLNLASIISERFREIPLEDITLGSFRMNRGFLEKAREARSDASILFESYAVDGERAGYAPALRTEMVDTVAEGLGEFKVCRG